MRPAATALSKICFLKPGVEEKREKQQLRPRQTRDFSVGLATAGALFAHLKTFNIRAADAHKTRARRVCALSVEKRCKTPPNAAPLYSERQADNSRVCCARGFAALHLVYCSYCEQRSRHSCHPWRRYRHRLQYPVLSTARRRLTEEQAEFTTHATGSVSQNVDSVLPPLVDPLLVVFCDPPSPDFGALCLHSVCS